MSRPDIMTFAVDWALKPIIYSSMNSELVDCVYSVSMNGSAVTEKDHGCATDSFNYRGVHQLCSRNNVMFENSR